MISLFCLEMVLKVIAEFFFKTELCIIVIYLILKPSKMKTNPFKLSLLLATVAITLFTASCKKEDKTTPATNTGGNSFKATKFIVSYSPGDTIIHEFDANKILIKETVIENEKLQRSQSFSRANNKLYVTYYNDSNKIDGQDTISLDSRGLITAYDEFKLTYNDANYLINLKIGTTEIVGAYVNDNLVSETLDGETINYEYYTDKIDSYRLNCVLGEDDGIMGGYVYYPNAGKSSKNLLKKINYGGGEVYNLTYEFDSNGLPSKIFVTEGGSPNSTTINVLFK